MPSALLWACCCKTSHVGENDEKPKQILRRREERKTESKWKFCCQKFSSCRSVTSWIFTKENFSRSGEKIAEKTHERAEKLVKLGGKALQAHQNYIQTQHRAMVGSRVKGTPLENCCCTSRENFFVLTLECLRESRILSVSMYSASRFLPSLSVCLATRN